MKILTGKVVSTKMTKTIVVDVVRQRFHPRYKKIIRRSKRYKVHCEDQSIKEGDVVKIVSCRPVSANKHFKLLSRV